MQTTTTNVKDYCEKLSSKIKEITDKMPAEIDNNFLTKNPLWDLFFYSDHLPISVNISIQDNVIIPVTTYNVFNKKYLKYLQLEQDGRNQRLYGHPISISDHEQQIKRELDIAQSMINLINDNKDSIICLQEVSDTFLEILKIYNFNNNIQIEITRKNSKTTTFDNCNLVIYNNTKYTLKNKKELINEDTLFYTFEKVDSGGILFNVASVHLSWSSSKNYGKIFLENKEVLYPLIIAGDINKGVVYPISEDGAHLTKEYMDERFRFPLPSEGSRPYSHICHLRNVGGNDYRRMLDKFDHIFVMLPP